SEGDWYFLWRWLGLIGIYDRYFDTNGQRFPHKGTIKLGKNETFEPEDPKPTLFATMVTAKKDPIIVHFKVKVILPLLAFLMVFKKRRRTHSKMTLCSRGNTTSSTRNRTRWWI